MLINFWYAAAYSEEVTADKPLKVKMLGQNFAVFRDSKGNVQCVSDVCIHRSASLAGGKIKGDCIECPYHGWQFNGEGDCTRIPSMGVNATPPARAKIDAYPVEERYGLVHVFLGDLPEEERPPILEVPEFDLEGWRAIHLEYDWEAHWERSMEAALDPAHAEFVHTGMKFAGSDEDYIIPELEVTRTKWGSELSFDLLTVAARKELQKFKPDAAQVTAFTAFHGPCCSVTRLDLAPGQTVIQYTYETPVDEFHVKKHLVSLRTMNLDPDFDEATNKTNLFVANEDKGLIEIIDPAIYPESNTKELLVPADKQIAIYREMIAEWEARGWRIDTRKVTEDRGRVGYAVPSPARRTSGNWTLDATPLLPGAAGESAKAVA
jgi:phenylpropionate dioxygenase-like ring-hydroxylating dioxygenase large terminal subunit